MSDETKAPENVPYIVYESTQARNERHIKRLVAALIIAIIMIFASNFMWLAYINQYDFAEYEYTQDGRGVNIIGDMNGVDFDGSEVTSEDTNNYYPYPMRSNENMGGQSNARRRDSRGRYSRESREGYSRDEARDEMLSDLRDMMRDTHDERMKSKIQRFISEIENS